LGAQHTGQIECCIVEVRFVQQRLPVTGDGAITLASRLMHHAQVIPGFSKAGIKRKSLLVGDLGALVIAGFSENVG